MKAQVNEIKEGLQHFHGSEMFYQIPLIRTRFTNGLKYLANVAECFWLITDVSVIAARAKSKRIPIGTPLSLGAKLLKLSKSMPKRAKKSELLEN